MAPDAAVRAETSRAVILLTLAMAAFAVEDAFIKGLSATLPVGQIVLVLGAGGTILFGGACLATGRRLAWSDFVHPLVLIRNLAEMLGTLCFVTALARVPLSLASAILQATPLLVMAGAALFLGETVGWRRWTAVAVGLAGMLVILRPGLDGFDPDALFAVGGMLCLAVRDVATRRVPPAIPTPALAAYAFAMVVPAGAALAVWEGGLVRPDAAELRGLAACLLFGGTAYLAVTAAMRMGEVAVVAPFRYARLLFALVLGAVFFGERPDAATLIGAAIVVGSGLYGLRRQRRAPALPRSAEQP